MISVIVTCYNLERYIGDCLESMLGQDIGEAYEVVVVDDCSTDGSAARIAQFDSVRRVSTPANSGVMEAMLLGLREAHGELIFLLDGDDLWHRSKLSKVVELFHRNPRLAFVTHNLTCIDEQGRDLPRLKLVEQGMDRVPAAAQSQRIRDGILGVDDYVWLGSAIAFRRSLCRIDEFERFVRAHANTREVYQDWPLAMWIAALDDEREFAYLPDVLLSYRIHGANHSGDARSAAKALRNVRRARNTTALMIAIAEHFGRDEPRRLTGRFGIDQLQVALFEGRRRAALSAYFDAVGELVRRKSWLTETARLVLGVVLGPERLVRTVNWFKSRRPR